MKAIIRSEFEMFKLKSDDDIEFDFEENQCDVDEFVEDREKFWKIPQGFIANTKWGVKKLLPISK